MEDGFARLGAVGEDLEDHFLAVDDGQFGEFLPVALLGGREGFVEDNDVAAFGFCEFDQLFCFAAAKERGGGSGTELDELGSDDRELQIFDQFGEFIEELSAFAGGHVFGLNAD